jgi:hypothetical protein
MEESSLEQGNSEIAPLMFLKQRISCAVRTLRLHFIPPYCAEDRCAEKRGFRFASPPSAARRTIVRQ